MSLENNAEDRQILNSYWEWVMFDSTTCTSHDVICHNCRKPRMGKNIDICQYCGAHMQGSRKDWEDVINRFKQN